MSDTTNTNLKEAKAVAYSAGLLSEMVLEEKKDDEGRDIIEGYLTVKTSDVNFVKYKAKANKLTQDGKENSIYKGLQTCKEEYKTIKEVGEAEATQLIVKGKINAYTGRNGDVVNFQSNFFNRANRPLTTEDMKSEFEVEVYIKSLVPEVDTEGVETGAVIVHGWMPTYNGIEPIALKAPATDGIADAVMDSYEAGQTVLFTGEIINNRIEHIKEIPMKIGKPKVEITYDYKNDMLITGASEPYEDENAYDKDTVALAINVRNEKMAQRQNQTVTPAPQSRPSAQSKGRSLGF